MTENKEKSKYDVAREIVRLSELYMDGMIRFSLASDTRSMQMSSMLAGASTALVGSSLVLLTSDGFSRQVHFVLGMAALACGICFMGALYCGLRAAKPRPFHVSGNYFDQWNSEEDLERNLDESLLIQAAIYQVQINENSKQLSANAERVNALLKLLGAGPLVGFGVGIAAWLVTLA